MRIKIYIFFVVLWLFSCKKSGRETPPSKLVGVWKCVQIKETRSYYVVPYPHMNSVATTVQLPDKTYIIDISPRGSIYLSEDGTTVLEEDIYTDETETNVFRVHYYGTRKNRQSQYFEATWKSDTLIVQNFFPKNFSSEHLGGGHGGTTLYYSYSNYFVRK